MTNFWGEESREIVRRVRLEFLYRVSPFRIASQTICETFNASQYMCSDGLRVTWNFSIRSSPPLGIFPPPSLIPSQTICHTLLCNRLCRVCTVFAWLEWPQKHDFVPSSERGICSTRSWRMSREWLHGFSAIIVISLVLAWKPHIATCIHKDHQSTDLSMLPVIPYNYVSSLIWTTIGKSSRSSSHFLDRIVRCVHLWNINFGN